MFWNSIFENYFTYKYSSPDAVRFCNQDLGRYYAYLRKIFYYNTGEKLNLKNPKTICEKIQWLKLFDFTPIKTQLTDKLQVRDFVKDKIGEKYLKPVLWVGKSFDDIFFPPPPLQKIQFRVLCPTKW